MYNTHTSNIFLSRFYDREERIFGRQMNECFNNGDIIGARRAFSQNENNFHWKIKAIADSNAPRGQATDDRNSPLGALRLLSDARYALILLVILEAHNIAWVDLDKILIMRVLEIQDIEPFKEALKNILAVRGIHNPKIFFYGAEYITDAKD